MDNVTRQTEVGRARLHGTLPSVDCHRSYGQHLHSVLSGEQPGPIYLGVSIKNKMATRRNLRKTIRWLTSYAPTALVFIGDVFYRHNLIALRGLASNAAMDKALDEGERTAGLARSVIAEQQASDRVNVITAAELTTQQDYEPIEKLVAAYYAQNPQFATEIRKTVHSFLQKAEPNCPDALIEDKLDILKDFVLEEVSVALQLYAQGFKIDVYPGPDVPALQSITQGRHPELSFECPDRTYLALNLEHELST